jgi:tRNA G26 N,N-dimethylase Trm1
MQEGQAKILMPEEVYQRNLRDRGGVLGRDLTIDVVSHFSKKVMADRVGGQLAKSKRSGQEQEGISLLDLKSFTGLKAVRYLQEVSDLSQVVINCPLERHTPTIDLIEKNLVANGQYNADVKVTNLHANKALYSHILAGKCFDVVDIDTDKSAVEYLDAAVQVVAGDGGLLCITQRDGNLAKASMAEAVFSRYGVVPSNEPYNSELALRILLQAVESAANRHKRNITPWLSVYSNYSLRVYVRVFNTATAKDYSSLANRMWVFQSSLCSSFHTQSVGVQLDEPYVPASSAAASVAGRDISASSDTSENSNIESSESAPRAEPSVHVGTKDVEEERAAGNQGGSGTGMKYVPSRWSLPEVCEESGGQWKIGGPYWGGPLHHKPVVGTLLQSALRVRQEEMDMFREEQQRKANKNKARAKKSGTVVAESKDTAVQLLQATTVAQERVMLLSAIAAELPDVPLFYCARMLAANAQTVQISQARFRSALVSQGYRVSGFHSYAHAIKTDAPNSVVSGSD